MAADPANESAGPRHGLATTTLLVVTSMIGSGVFTTSGLLLADLHGAVAVLFVWLVGGLASLAGAWVYSELAVAARENGGEYALVSRYLHPAVGFVVGLVTFVVGFCAPIAACAFAFARYACAAAFDVVPDPQAPASPLELALALGVIVIAAALHARESVPGASSLGVRIQDALTLGKLGLVILVIAVGLAVLAMRGLPEGSSLASSSLDDLARASPRSLGLGVVVASFAYSGWNAAAYFAGEVERPERTLPRALAGGTALVTLLYLLVNVVFLASAPARELEGQIVVGHVAARALLGPAAARALSAVIAFGLLSTLSAFAWTGLRIIETMGRHHQRLARLRERRVALGLELGLSIAMLLTTSFDVLLGSVGFALSVASALTVLAIFRVRREDAAYRAPLHPLPALFYLALMVGIVVSTLFERPVLAVAGAVPAVLGLVGYAVVTRKPQQL